MNYVEVFGWLLLVNLVVISASPTQARDTVEPVKHRLVFPSNKHFISFLTISFSFITYPIQMEIINIWKNNTYYIFKFYCKSRATDFLCSWNFKQRTYCVYFFRVKRKKNLWLNKPKRMKNCDVWWGKIVEILSTYNKIFLLRHNH
jgi:hypothetical protein